MAKRKQLHYNKLTMDGMYVDNKCPECEGDGVDFIDFTHAGGGKMIPQLCGMCEGKGFVKEGVDFDILTFLDEDGNEHVRYMKIVK